MQGVTYHDKVFNSSGMKNWWYQKGHKTGTRIQHSKIVNGAIKTIINWSRTNLQLHITLPL
jgi:hypothetical protein